MSTKLNLDSFNEMLMKHLPVEARKEMLEIELQTAYTLKIELMEELVECLNNGDTYKELLRRINNVDSACDKLNKMLEAYVDVE